MWKALELSTFVKEIMFGGVWSEFQTVFLFTTSEMMCNYYL